jgi:hypothetical protein
MSWIGSCIAMQAWPCTAPQATRGEDEFGRQRPHQKQTAGSKTQCPLHVVVHGRHPLDPQLHRHAGYGTQPDEPLTIEVCSGRCKMQRISRRECQRATAAGYLADDVATRTDDARSHSLGDDGPRLQLRLVPSSKTYQRAAIMPPQVIFRARKLFSGLCVPPPPLPPPLAKPLALAACGAHRPRDAERWRACSPLRSDVAAIIQPRNELILRLQQPVHSGARPRQQRRSVCPSAGNEDHQSAPRDDRVAADLLPCHHASQPAQSTQLQLSVGSRVSTKVPRQICSIPTL